VALAVGVIVAGSAAGCRPQPLTVSTVVAGLSNAWDIAFTPGGSMFFTEAQWTVLTDRGRLRSAVQGPDGNLYISTDAADRAGAILVVTPTA
jgi:glucose/arabinose dehydrogenase